MLKLAGGTHFILLKTAGERQQVFSFRRFDDAIHRFDGNSRLSPLFAVDESPPPQFQQDAKTYLIFLGPVYPGDIRLPERSHGYLSLGILNVLLFCPDSETYVRAKEMVVGLGCGFECWTIDGHIVIDLEHFFPGAVKIPEEVSGTIRLDRAPMVPTAREFQTLVANVFSKSQLYEQSAAEDFLRFNSVLRQLVMSSEVHDVEKLQSLTTANVSLARYTWQTFGGSSPLIQSSIQIATHSLMGIGTASLALQRLARYVEGVFEKGQIGERVRRLQNVPPGEDRLLSIPSDDRFWDQSFLSSAPPNIMPSVQSQHLPQITSYSARDGFRSTAISLSAPIEVITGCNTPSWTLQTLTHEMSHTQLRSILGMLLPDQTDPSDFEQLWQYVSSRAMPLSLYWQLRVFLIDSVLLMRASASAQTFDQSELLTALRANSREADEILTHVFDFMYFYGKDPEKYIRAIWASWATIPHIHDRVSDYIVRTLCALHSNNLRRDDSYEISLAAFEVALSALKNDFPDSLYIPQALQEIDDNRDRYLAALRSRTPLVKFGTYFLWCSDIYKALSRNMEVVSSLKSGVFTEERSANPLGFIAEWSQDKTPDAIRAVWILQHLAYGVND